LVVVAAADQLAVTLTPQVARRVGGVKYSLDELLDQSTAGDVASGRGVASGRAFHATSPGDVISGRAVRATSSIDVISGDVVPGRTVHSTSPGDVTSGRDVISGLTFFSSTPPKTSTAHARLSTFFLPSTGC